MLCVVILSVADRNHSRMDVTQMLYWKDNTLKLHRSFLSFTHTKYVFIYNDDICDCIYVCVMRSAAVHQTPHIQTSVEVPNAA